MPRAGLTLIEMLIVIVLIATLAMFVAPRVLGAGRQAREAALAGDLHELGQAITLFAAQCGDYPAKLTDLVSPSAPAAGGNGVPIDPRDWRGPYLVTPDGALPVDPITGKCDWRYDEETGQVGSASNEHSTFRAKHRHR